jgi:hypothetical protein
VALKLDNLNYKLPFQNLLQASGSCARPRTTFCINVMSSNARLNALGAMDFSQMCVQGKRIFLESKYINLSRRLDRYRGVIEENSSLSLGRWDVAQMIESDHGGRDRKQWIPREFAKKVSVTAPSSPSRPPTRRDVAMCTQIWACRMNSRN